MTSPYNNCEPRAFWRSGVVERHPLDLGDIYRKKFTLTSDDRIATAGSCFAQHISSRLRELQYHVIDAEPPPPNLDIARAKEFGFLLYSARYGNIYTVRQLWQLAQEAEDLRKPAELVWSSNGRFFDALRPSVEPKGFDTPELVLVHRLQHIARVRRVLRSVSVFIFTLGLTETWEHTGDGTVYPTAPGTIAGRYDPSAYRFRNLSYEDTKNDFLHFRRLLKKHNPGIRFLLTVSPVPLTATATSEHVITATTYSKSVLRAVAGSLAEEYSDIDYFPSFEIIAGIQSRGIFYESNLRSVSNTGVDIVMKHFIREHSIGLQVTRAPHTAEAPPHASGDSIKTAEQIYCEEELLDRFAS